MGTLCSGRPVWWAAVAGGGSFSKIRSTSVHRLRSRAARLNPEPSPFCRRLLPGSLSGAAGLVPTLNDNCYARLQNGAMRCCTVWALESAQLTDYRATPSTKGGVASSLQQRSVTPVSRFEKSSVRLFWRSPGVNNNLTPPSAHTLSNRHGLSCHSESRGPFFMTV